MCTALTLPTGDRYFGRTLDLDRFYGEEVCITPRNCPLEFRQKPALQTHYALIGMATVVEGVPLYYEAVNEHGLGMAGLNFPGNAHYFPTAEGRDNIAPFEFIPWILGQCRTLREVRGLLETLHLTDTPYSPALLLSPLHWIISDGAESLVVESMAEGLHIHENPAGVMTNNPPLPYQLKNLEQYRHLRVDNQGAVLPETEGCTAYCQGLGAVGLPGDVSSMSRFVRAAFGRAHAVFSGEEADAVGQFFHLMDTVSMVRGLCKTDAGSWDITGYTCCVNLKRGRYYYTTYGNRRITCVDMHREELEGSRILRFPLQKEESIYCQN